MSWKYRQPREEDFDTYEEYEEELERYERAEDAYAERYIEERLMERC